MVISFFGLSQLFPPGPFKICFGRFYWLPKWLVYPIRAQNSLPNSRPEKELVLNRFVISAQKWKFIGLFLER